MKQSANSATSKLWLRVVWTLSVCGLFSYSPYLLAQKKASGVMFNPSFFIYQNDSVIDPDTSGKTTEGDAKTYLSMGLGYVFPSGILLGVRLLNQSRAQSSQYADEDKVTLTKEDQATGISIGYAASMGLSLEATYLISYDYTLKSESGSSSSEFTSEGGSGILGQLSWRFPVGSALGIGPQLLYKSVSFTKLKHTQSSTEIEGTFKETEMLPMIGFWLFF